MLSTIDRLDILDVVARADNSATSRDADAYVSFFTEEAVLDGEMGEYRGKERLRQSVGPIWQSEGASSTHATLNVVIEAMEGQPDRAITTSLLMILRNESAVSIASVSSIIQHLVKVDSQWLIERRSVQSVSGTSEGR
jgi:hypothetical protein